MEILGLHARKKEGAWHMNEVILTNDIRCIMFFHVSRSSIGWGTCKYMNAYICMYIYIYIYTYVFNILVYVYNLYLYMYTMDGNIYDCRCIYYISYRYVLSCTI